MRKPNWTKSKDKNELFWVLVVLYVIFLDLLFPHILPFIKINRREQVSLTGEGQSNEFMHKFGI